MYEETKQFLDLIFDKNDLVEFRLIKMPGTGDGSIESRSGDDKTKFAYLWGNLAKITSDEFLKEIDEWNNKLYHIFFGPNPRKKIVGVEDRKRGEKSDKQNISECRLLFVDIDAKAGKENLGMDELYDYCLLKIRSLGVPEPSVAVLSGHGYHFYWLLQKSTDVAVLRPYQSGLIDALGADTKCKDSTRILRLPGFLNVKKQPYVKCRIVYINVGIYELNQFDCVKGISGVGCASDSNADRCESENENKSEDNQWLDFRFLNVRAGLIAEHIQPDSGTIDAKIRCVFASNYHESKIDKNPSCSVGMSGKKKGMYHCFACKPELADGWEKGNIIKLIIKRRHDIELATDKTKIKWEKLNDKDLQKRYWDVVHDLEKRFPGFCKLTHGKILYSLSRPGDNANKIISKFFVIPRGPDKEMIAFVSCDGFFYYGDKSSWYIIDILGSIVTTELQDGFYNPKKSLGRPEKFPADDRRKEAILKMMENMYNVYYIRSKLYSREQIEILRDNFWIDTLGVE